MLWIGPVPAAAAAEAAHGAAAEAADGAAARATATAGAASRDDPATRSPGRAPEPRSSLSPAYLKSTYP